MRKRSAHHVRGWIDLQLFNAWTDWPGPLRFLPQKPVPGFGQGQKDTSAYNVDKNAMPAVDDYCTIRWDNCRAACTRGLNFPCNRELLKSTVLRCSTTINHEHTPIYFDALARAHLVPPAALGTRGTPPPPPPTWRVTCPRNGAKPLHVSRHTPSDKEIIQAMRHASCVVWTHLAILSQSPGDGPTWQVGGPTPHWASPTPTMAVGLPNTNSCTLLSSKPLQLLTGRLPDQYPCLPYDVSFSHRPGYQVDHGHTLPRAALQAKNPVMACLKQKLSTLVWEKTCSPVRTARVTPP
jgi:hypothetical protein